MVRMGSMRRSRSGFAWPVYAAFGVFFVGRVSYMIISEYQEGGVVAVIVGFAVGLVVVGLCVWRKRRRIRDWAAEEPPRN